MQRKVTAAREIIMNSFHRPCKDCGIFHNRWGRSTGHTHGAIYDVPGYLNFDEVKHVRTRGYPAYINLGGATLHVNW